MPANVLLQAVRRLDRTSGEPLYIQLADLLREYLKTEAAYRAGKLPKELDLAKLFGVSRVTVTQALSILQQEQLICRIKHRGTFLASRIAEFDPQSIQRTIGIVFPYIWQGFIDDIRAAAQKDGFRSRFYCYDPRNVEDEIRVLRKAQRTCAGVIFHPICIQDDYSFLYDLILSGYPIVFLGFYYDFLECHSVCDDHGQGGYRLAETLILKGGRRPCLILPEKRIASLMHRVTGMLQAFNDYRIPITPEQIIPHSLSVNYKEFAARFREKKFDCGIGADSYRLEAMLNSGEFDFLRHTPFASFNHDPMPLRKEIIPITSSQPKHLAVQALLLLKEILHSGPSPARRKILIAPDIYIGLKRLPPTAKVRKQFPPQPLSSNAVPEDVFPRHLLPLYFPGSIPE